MSCVYVLKGTASFCDKVLYKVGHTLPDSPDKRRVGIAHGLVPFATVEPFKHWNFATEKDTIAIEEFLKKIFRSLCVGGEWFNLTHKEIGWLDVCTAESLLECFHGDLRNIDEYIFVRSEDESSTQSYVPYQPAKTYVVQTPIEDHLRGNFTFGGKGTMTGSDICVHLLHGGAIESVDRSSLTRVGIALRKLGVRKFRDRNNIWVYEGIDYKS